MGVLTEDLEMDEYFGRKFSNAMRYNSLIFGQPTFHTCFEVFGRETESSQITPGAPSFVTERKRVQQLRFALLNPAANLGI